MEHGRFQKEMLLFSFRFLRYTSWLMSLSLSHLSYLHHHAAWENKAYCWILSMSAMKMMASVKSTLRYDMTVLQGAALNREVNFLLMTCTNVWLRHYLTVRHVWHAYINVSEPVSSLCRIFCNRNVLLYICHNDLFSLDEPFEHTGIISKLKKNIFLYLNSVKMLKYIRFS